MKYIISILILGFIFVIGLIGYGLYSMEIEDHYGNLQELYYDSKSGDIIINKTILEFGIIEKNWRRINIRTKDKDSTDLYNWIYPNIDKTKTEIYRPIMKIDDFKKLNYSDVIEKINTSQMILINSN